ncbi:hypothetical protein F444_22660, partial [Phytophthora nicotianae P1976]
MMMARKQAPQTQYTPLSPSQLSEDADLRQVDDRVSLSVGDYDPGTFVQLAQLSSAPTATPADSRQTMERYCVCATRRCVTAFIAIR